MSYSQDAGYQPSTFSQIMDRLRLAINAQFGTTYTEGNFIGTNWYKFYYGPVQEISQNEIKASEIFLKLQEYINQTNLRIQRPSVSLPGLIDSFTARGYVASVKKNLLADAGTVSLCFDVDADAPDYAVTKLAICNLLKDFVGAGMVFIGTETESITLTNGQEFDFSYALPDYTPVLLRLTLTSSDNQSLVIPNDEEIRETLYANILGDATTALRYRLGWDFEPQRYYTQVDAPWAATILLEYSDDDGLTWDDAVFQAAFDDLLTFELDDITVLVDP